MILYHGSTSVVTHPNVRMSRPNLDFGQGFYLTSFKNQATDWAKRKGFLNKSTAYVNQYDVDENFDDCAVLRFSDTDAEWVNFVCDCRRGKSAWQYYDLVVGGVADDRVYYAVDMYYQGLWDIQRTLKALRFYKVSDQWCFLSQRVLDQKVRYSRHWEIPYAND